MKTSFEALEIGSLIENLHETVIGFEKKKKILGENLLWGAYVDLLIENLIEVASRPRKRKGGEKNHFSMYLFDECRFSPTSTRNKNELPPKKEKIGQT